MQVLTRFATLGALAFACAALLHGLANTLDWVAYRVHRIARALREMQAVRSAQMNERWIRELERE